MEKAKYITIGRSVEDNALGFKSRGPRFNPQPDVFYSLGKTLFLLPSHISMMIDIQHCLAPSTTDSRRKVKYKP